MEILSTTTNLRLSRRCDSGPLRLTVSCIQVCRIAVSPRLRPWSPRSSVGMLYARFYCSRLISTTGSGSLIWLHVVDLLVSGFHLTWYSSHSSIHSTGFLITTMLWSLMAFDVALRSNQVISFCAVGPSYVGLHGLVSLPLCSSSTYLHVLCILGTALVVPLAGSVLSFVVSYFYIFAL